MSAKVMSFDGDVVGDLLAATPDAFCVRTSDGREVWVSARAVYQERGSDLVLICYRSGLGRWETSQPGAA